MNSVVAVAVDAPEVDVSEEEVVADWPHSLLSVLRDQTKRFCLYRNDRRIFMRRQRRYRLRFLWSKTTGVNGDTVIFETLMHCFVKKKDKSGAENTLTVIMLQGMQPNEAVLRMLKARDMS